jgi:hypothetical protein
MQHNEKPDPAISRELITYLGNLPRELNEQGTHAAGRVAVQIGNCLLWLHDHIAPHEHKVEQPLDEPAVTVWALAKQFRAVGMKLYDNPSASKLEKRVAYLEQALANFVTTGRFGTEERGPE